MERKYELYFLKDSPPGHHWDKNSSDELDKKQHWKKGQIYSEFTWDKEKNGEYKPPFDIFGVREV